MNPLSRDQLIRLDQLMDSLSWEDKLNQIQVTYKMTQEECLASARSGIGALFWPGNAADTNAIQRAAVQESAHGIPLLIGLDVIHGQHTIFPIPLAMAASFDEGVARACAATSGVEARSGGVNWTYSPMVDVSRDARWGRVAEGFGEDPVVSSVMGAAMVRGYQGEQLDAESMMAACVKHFVGYGAAEGGRDYNTVDMSDKRLHEVYLPPFRACVNAGAATVTASFNTLNGRPVHANRAMLTGALKDAFGFGGFIVGDASGVENLIPHGVAADIADAARIALGAGLDMEMGGHIYTEEGALFAPDDPALVKRVDDACRRVLTIKLALGLFDNPYVDEDEEILEPTADHLVLAREQAGKCPVLLTNDGTLPIAPDSQLKILLTGPGATSRDHLGAWVQRFGTPPSTTLATTLANALPKCRFTVLPGCSELEASPDAIEEARTAALEHDLVIVALNEPSDLTGEATSRADLRLPGDQEALVLALADTGVPVVAVLTNGRPLDLSAWAHRVNALLEAWHLGTTGPEVIADILTGTVNPTGRLPMAFPRHVGQLPAVHHAHENTGRPPSRGGSMQPKSFDVGLDGPANIQEFFTSKYRDLELGPLFAFGHGLGYASLEAVGLGVDRSVVTMDEVDAGGSIAAVVSVRNDSDADAEHPVLVYVRDILASHAPVVRTLAAFTRVRVPARTTVEVAVDIPLSGLAFWDEDARALRVEAGDFEVIVDGATAPLIATFIVTE